MRGSEAAVHYLLIFLFLCVGLFFISLPIAPHLRYLIYKNLLYNPEMFFSIGLSILCVTFLLLVGFYMFHRRRFLRIKMKADPIEVDQAIIIGYLQSYWKDNYPEKQVQTDVMISKTQKLEITAYIEPLTSSEQEAFLSRVEKEVGALLLDLFKYQKDFYFTLSTKPLSP